MTRCHWKRANRQSGKPITTLPQRSTNQNQHICRAPSSQQALWYAYAENHLERSLCAPLVLSHCSWSEQKRALPTSDRTTIRNKLGEADAVLKPRSLASLLGRAQYWQVRHLLKPPQYKLCYSIDLVRYDIYVHPSIYLLCLSICQYTYTSKYDAWACL